MTGDTGAHSRPHPHHMPGERPTWTKSVKEAHLDQGRAHGGTDLVRKFNARDGEK